MRPAVASCATAALLHSLSPAQGSRFRSRLVCRDRLRISFSFMARSHLRVHLFHSHYHCLPKFYKIMQQRLQQLLLLLFVRFFQFVCGKVLHECLCQRNCASTSYIVASPPHDNVWFWFMAFDHQNWQDAFSLCYANKQKSKRSVGSLPSA